MKWRGSEEAGFTLVEILVAIFILAAAGLIYSELQVTQFESSHASMARTNAAFKAQDIMEILLASESHEDPDSEGLYRTYPFEYTVPELGNLRVSGTLIEVTVPYRKFSRPAEVAVYSFKRDR